MAQEIIVYTIGIVVLAYIIYKICRLIKRRRDPCAYCSGCEPGKTCGQKAEAGKTRR